LRDVISAYQTCVAETVRRFGGFVAKYMGDGVLVHFGYPQAYEDDAERAVSAGLELVAAVGGLKTHAPLQARVGTATGLVVVGDTPIFAFGPFQAYHVPACGGACLSSQSPLITASRGRHSARNGRD
jgi:class 3 adenylate cyclase